ncbi:MAG: metalloregulator ArsR/SmtB family transcription factor [Candidatus Lokiarchaeota archaeon]|nr:metalloregulator ArsR/SmtB family transcription factor [Candidatus Lokiarchaeota archaeon]MBD3340764.1 metalloregulator ArsR/SmtB family transcription factor [Candidatus Lokiarchaeota archaeon]
MNDILDYTVEFLKVLADQTRLEIIELIRNSESGIITSKKIQEELNKSQSTISQHLNNLIDASLITYDLDGNTKIYKINNEIVSKLYELLDLIQIFVVTINKDKFQTSKENNDVLDILF